MSLVVATKMNPPSAERVLREIRNAPNMDELWLTLHADLTLAQVAEISAAIAHSSIKTVNLQFGDDERLRAFLQPTLMSNLMHLSIFYVQLRASTACIIGNALVGSNVCSLSLREVEFHHGISCLAQRFPLTNIAELTISVYESTASEFMDALVAATHAPTSKLETIRIEVSNERVSSPNIIEKSLSCRVSKLVFQFFWFTDSDARMMARALRRSCVKELALDCIGYNGVGDDGAAALEDAISHSELQRLGVNWCGPRMNIKHALAVARLARPALWLQTTVGPVADFFARDGDRAVWFEVVSFP